MKSLHSKLQNTDKAIKDLETQNKFLYSRPERPYTAKMHITQTYL